MPAAALACFPDAPLLRSEAGPALHEMRVRATPFLTAQQSWQVFGDGFHDDYDVEAVVEAGAVEVELFGGVFGVAGELEVGLVRVDELSRRRCRPP